jgi:hypothetical protein
MLFGLRTYKLFLLFQITDMMSVIKTKQLIKKRFNKTESRYWLLIQLLHSAPVISPPWSKFYIQELTVAQRVKEPEVHYRVHECLPLA